MALSYRIPHIFVYSQETVLIPQGNALEWKIVMYNIASNLNGIFRRIGKATEWKIDCKRPSG